MKHPYLPDIIKAVVQRVDTVMFSGTNPFHVYFSHGIYEQVGRWVAENPDKFPLVWFDTRFSAKRGIDPTIFAETVSRIYIIDKTDNKYSQDQRDSLTIKPRLLPTYEQLLIQLHNENLFETQSPDKIFHSMELWPFWGFGDVNGQDKENMFQKMVDAIFVTNLTLKVRFTC
jgi:hypothetical protein